MILVYNIQTTPNVIIAISIAFSLKVLAAPFKWKRGGNKKQSGIQQTEPIMETNLSRSAEPMMATSAQKNTIPNLNTFFDHLTTGFRFPDLVKTPVSTILMAGKICKGIDKQMASAYNPWIALTK